MAKSKSGGSRAFIRGKLGNDVYNIGKDGLGKKQQVVRSLAESVANPQTSAQMFGRMVMSTVMQAQSAFAFIVDHSFDGVPNGQPSISEFIRRNYSLVAADAKAHPATGNKFDLVPYKKKGFHRGSFVMSDGDQAPFATSLMLVGDDGDSLKIYVEEGETIGSLKAKMNFGADDYFTLMGQFGLSGTNAKFVYNRFRFNPAMADTTVITNDNVNTVFLQETNFEAEVLTRGSSSIVASSDVYKVYIISRKVNGAYHHSSCQFDVEGLSQFAANNVLPTYPVGQQRFLNGGEV